MTKKDALNIIKDYKECLKTGPCTAHYEMFKDAQKHLKQIRKKQKGD